jgi:nitrous oxidase accessory protein NosD
VPSALALRVRRQAAVGQLLLVAVCLAPALAPVSPEARQEPPLIALRAGLVVDHPVRVRPGTYRLASADLDRPALVIRGSGVTVDLTGVTIEGADRGADPDTLQGVAVLVDHASRATIRGGAIRGYKVGILARRSPGLHVTGTDVSYNWKPHLLSGIEQENQADWLSYHNNEQDEWLRYGAAIYLSESDEAEIDHTRAVQGMNGLMVTRSARLAIWNNTFSWLSGVGIGLYRTTESRILHNRIDWCVRGFSDGFYSRGQDSAGVLMYEQSTRNIVAYNSITHGGDGVFLWAGQSTMDTGQGGANDNVFYDNDVSHAVANGIEATFSRNVIVGNRIDDCVNGIWGGYSFDSLIARNAFAGNTDGIAIEHGQHITIRDNTFADEATAIRVWANATEDPNWGYPKHRDTRSRDYLIAGNRFDKERTAVTVRDTNGIRLAANQYTQVTTPLETGAAVTDLVDRPFESPPPAIAFVPPDPIAGGMDAKLPAGARRGRATIIVDEWGPYDYRSPKLWPAGKPGDRPLTLRVLGPEGRWTLASIAGASAAPASGSVPDEVVVTPAGANADLRVDLEYIGAEIVTPRGQIVTAGRPFQFSYALFDPAIDWTLRFWRFDATSDPLTDPVAFEARLASPPVRTDTTRRLAFANAQAFGDGFADHIAIVADGAVDLASGPYDLVVTSDDGVRVWVDGRLAIDDWSIHAAKEDRVPFTGGPHRLRLEYFQNTGAAALEVQVVRR